ncbi:MAG: hypothetical protein IJN62_02785 [Clostridia bacterium]|nr:hypothetical protein [Clostridia bacterium]
MDFIIDHDYHVHSQLSIDIAAGEGYDNDAILDYADKSSLKKVCLTNHFWDETVPCDFEWYQQQGYTHLSKALPLPKRDDVEFFFGCEADVDKNLNIGITKQTAEKFDFIIVSTTHMHMQGFTTDLAAYDINGRREEYLARIKKVLSADLPLKKIGLAHLTSVLICPDVEDGHIKVLSGISDSEYKDVFAKVAALGAGIEINVKAFRCSDGLVDELLRPYKIAAECGCRFYLGSDSHFPNDLATAKDGFKRILNMLAFEEEQKFRF